MIYVLAYPVFAAPVTQALARFRGTYEPERARLVRPHVTLVFAQPGKRAEAVIRASSQIAATTAPVDLTFTAHTLAFDRFESAHKLFLLPTRGRQALCRLYAALNAAEQTQDAFRPHMTVATDAREERVHRARAAWALPLPISARIESLEVVRLSGKRLQPVASVPFEGNDDAPDTKT